ncbi:MAG: TlpA disulfide reductase family protein [Planctomycetota bacterium]
MFRKLTAAATVLLILSCTTTRIRPVERGGIDRLKKFAAENEIKGLIVRIDKNEGPNPLKINGLPTVLVVNDKLELLYRQLGYSSRFKKGLKEAIDCNTVLCALDSEYLKAKSKYAGMYVNDLGLKDLDGGWHRLSSLVKKNSVAVIDIWATWCRPCLMVNKDIAELHEEYKGTDVRFVAINVDKIEE